MQLKINPDYFKRHLFVTLLMLGLGLWFGYDGFIRYPATPAAELYRSIEGAAAPDGFDLEAFKTQKTQTQYGFTALCLLASLIVGLRLTKATRFRFEFDEQGFTYRNHHYTYADIVGVNRSQWEKKSIIFLKLKSGEKITLDAWHHLGVKDFATMIRGS